MFKFFYAYNVSNNVIDFFKSYFNNKIYFFLIFLMIVGDEDPRIWCEGGFNQNIINNNCLNFTKNIDWILETFSAHNFSEVIYFEFCREKMCDNGATIVQPHCKSTFFSTKLRMNLARYNILPWLHPIDPKLLKGCPNRSLRNKDPVKIK